MKTIEWPKWPQYGPEEEIAVARVIKSNQLFADREVKDFEKQYASYIGCNYALGLGNGTQGLHLALAALNIGIGDEVIVSPYSWISSSSCVLMQNAVPIFCDIEKDTLGICPKEIEKNISNKTKAIIIVHMFGYPAKINEIVSISEKYGIPLIEDASHAHGASVEEKKIGNFGLISVFSLHQRKALSVGDGGVVCTNNQGIYDKIRQLRSFGHEELSYNYRMTEFAGALGKVGLSKLDTFNSQKIENAFILQKLFNDNDHLKVRICSENEIGVYYAVLFEVTKNVVNLDLKISRLNKKGIPLIKTWKPLYKHPHFNPKSIPARGLPWKAYDYNGKMKNIEYKDIELSNTDYYCPSRILQLEVHPPIDKNLIEFAATEIKNEIN
jgi:perosamine synthetase